ncbi:MAG TPA: hypothetical protein VMI52_07800 [Acetobacteraceae bacterium]|nr:hypothetical protein [Acetobacteraceae bacterium]
MESITLSDRLEIPTPILGILEQHLASFEAFTVRQGGLNADLRKTIEHLQSQILKMRARD